MKAKIPAAPGKFFQGKQEVALQFLSNGPFFSHLLLVEYPYWDAGRDVVIVLHKRLQTLCRHWGKSQTTTLRQRNKHHGGNRWLADQCSDDGGWTCEGILVQEWSYVALQPTSLLSFEDEWERPIGVTRHFLDSMLLEFPCGRLTHEVVNTFLAEAATIVNSSPLVSSHLILTILSFWVLYYYLPCAETR